MCVHTNLDHLEGHSYSNGGEGGGGVGNEGRVKEEGKEGRKKGGRGREAGGKGAARIKGRDKITYTLH